MTATTSGLDDICALTNDIRIILHTGKGYDHQAYRHSHPQSFFRERILDNLDRLEGWFRFSMTGCWQYKAQCLKRIGRHLPQLPEETQGMISSKLRFVSR